MKDINNLSFIKQIINEEYFKIRESALDDVFDAINNLLVYIKYSVNTKYKLKFYIQQFIEALSKLKHGTYTTNEIDVLIHKLKLNFDGKYLDELGIIRLFEKLKKENKSDDVIGNYIVDVDDLIKDIAKKHENFYIEHSKRIKEERYFLQIELLKFQEWVIKNNKKVLIIFEGRDGSGKGRNIKKIVEYLNPKHYRSVAFGIPTEEEKKNWFERYKKVMPKEGEIVFFDRSWYNRGIIEPAMGYCTKEQYDDFMNTVCDFEKDLINDNINVIKIWLNISKLSQILRFELRKIDPLKYWKFSDNDEKILEKWDVLTPYINRILSETNHQNAEWNIIDANDKQQSFIDVMKIILNPFDYESKDYRLLNEKNPIIFLDLHGVLITDIYRDGNGNKICNKGWNKHAISNLNFLTEETNANIVLISTCKNSFNMKELKEMFKNAGINGNLIDKTIDIDKNLREKQIETWFEMNGKPKKWVIIDDKNYLDYSKYPHHFIQPNPNIGFSHDDLKNTLNILK